MRIVPLFLALAFCACTDGDPEPATSIAGDYNGTILVQHREAQRTIYASAHFQFAGSGELVDGMLVTASPTSVIGEVGTATGHVTMRDNLAGEAALTFALPTLGTYTLAGTLIYSDVTHSLSGMLTTRDAAGTVVGTTSLTVMR